MLQYITALPSPAWEQTFPRSVVLLGSTGSIGVSTLRIIERHPDLFTVTALAGGRNIERLTEQALRWRPPYLGVQTEEGRAALCANLPADYRPEIVAGPQGYAALAALPEASTVLSAQMGAAGGRGAWGAAPAREGLRPPHKETARPPRAMLRDLCTRSGAVILPVDSEHNAIFQGLQGRDPATVKRIILTASGGPFRGKDRAFLATVTPQQALKHPNWSMGAKITIDSASMMNKGLEVIEAHHLYGLPPERIGVLVHPQSLVHSLVEYADGSLMAQAGTPDMRLPIAYCLEWPLCLDAGVPPLDLAGAGALTFEEPDLLSFPCLDLARRTIGSGTALPVTLNAANEVAVAAFLAGRIGFMDIPDLIARALDACAAPDPVSLEDIEALDHETRLRVGRWIEKV